MLWTQLGGLEKMYKMKSMGISICVAEGQSQHYLENLDMTSREKSID